jgi:hypothetical protein
MTKIEGACTAHPKVRPFKDGSVGVFQQPVKALPFRNQGGIRVFFASSFDNRAIEAPCATRDCIKTGSARLFASEHSVLMPNTRARVLLHKLLNRRIKLWLATCSSKVDA